MLSDFFVLKSIRLFEKRQNGDFFKYNITDINNTIHKVKFGLKKTAPTKARNLEEWVVKRN